MATFNEIKADVLANVAGGECFLTDVARAPALRGIHFKRIVAAAESLNKAGHVSFDGVNIAPVVSGRRNPVDAESLAYLEDKMSAAKAALARGDKVSARAAQRALRSRVDRLHSTGQIPSYHTPWWELERKDSTAGRAALLDHQARNLEINPRRRRNPLPTSKDPAFEVGDIYRGRLHRSYPDKHLSGTIIDIKPGLTSSAYQYLIRFKVPPGPAYDGLREPYEQGVWRQEADMKANPRRRRNPDFSGALTISHEASGDVLIRHVAHNPRRRNPHYPEWVQEAIKAGAKLMSSSGGINEVRIGRYRLTDGSMRPGMLVARLGHMDVIDWEVPEYSAGEWVKKHKPMATKDKMAATRRKAQGFALYPKLANPARRRAIDKSSPKRRRNPEDAAESRLWTTGRTAEERAAYTADLKAYRDEQDRVTAERDAYVALMSAERKAADAADRKRKKDDALRRKLDREGAAAVVARYHARTHGLTHINPKRKNPFTSQPKSFREAPKSAGPYTVRHTKTRAAIVKSFSDTVDRNVSFPITVHMKPDGSGRVRFRYLDKFRDNDKNDSLAAKMSGQLEHAIAKAGGTPIPGGFEEGNNGQFFVYIDFQV